MHERTGGNPLEILQFLASLHAEGLLALDREDMIWRWQLEPAVNRGLTDDLVVTKLAALPPDCRRLVDLLACLGSEGEVELLAELAELPPDLAHRRLLPAVRGGLLLARADVYRFAHDRFRQTAYQAIPEHERLAAHLRIGRQLRARWSPGGPSGPLFELVGQLNRALALCPDGEERLALARLNRLAG